MLPADSLRDRILLLMETYPLQAGPLYTAYKDLALAVEWQDLRIVPLKGTEWVCIVGHKRREDALRIVLPLPLHTTALRPSSLKAIFSAVRSLDISTLPPADGPLIPTIAELRSQAGINQQSDESVLDMGLDSAVAGAAAPVATGGEQIDIEAGSEINNPSPGNDSSTNKEIDTDTLYMAIVTTDSTVVYYKLARGIRKPADIPDE